MGGTWVGFLINDDYGRVGSLGGANKTVCNAKAESKNPWEGVEGLNKGALQNAAIF